MSIVPEKYLDILEGPNLAHLATVMPDGSPQVTPVWFEFDGQLITFNSAKGRQKDKNLRHSPKVSMSIVDPKNPYRYLEVRGEIVEITEADGDAVIDQLAKRYMGVDSYPYRTPTEVRVTYRVKPTRSSGMG